MQWGISSQAQKNSRFAVVAALSLMILVPTTVLAQENCPPSSAIPVSVEAVVSGTMLRLDDGRVAKLAGVNIPEAAAIDARGFVQNLVKGALVSLAPLTANQDRYGRIIARARVTKNGGTLWLEEALVSAGLALANLYPGETGCFKPLLSAETRARQENAGYWGVDRAMRFAASNRDDIFAATGRFIVIEGTILRVTIRDYATFLDFGEDWQRDLSIMLPKAQRTQVETAIGSMQTMKGRKVQIRGIIAPGRVLRFRLTSIDQIRVIEE